MRRIGTTVLVATLVVLAGCAGGGDGGLSGGGDGGSGMSGDAAKVGLAAGGAQDATAFRNNVREGYVPQPTDVTYEGLFHDYYFDTGQESSCEELFCPSYSRAVSRDPVSNQSERYVAVGLNSGLSQADFERKRLNVVVVVDTSGSMGSPFDQYYYDGGERKQVESAQRKMAAARDAVRTMTDHLEADDRLGIVAYDDNARVVQKVSPVGEMGDGQIDRRIDSLNAGGSTNLDAGMRTATEMLRPYARPDDPEVETRVIYVTDAQPNTGQIGADALERRLSNRAEEGIHSTFVGVGVDFNTRLVESIYSTRGANYYAVHSPRQFRDRMAEGFDYMVTPLVYDLSLSVEGQGYEIAKVYGTDSDASTGELMHVNTLFPSRREGNKTEGGVVLLELERTGSDPTLELTASYENRAGETHETTRTVTFENRAAPYYESTGVRKAVALSRYATAVRNWAAYERAQRSGGEAEEPAEGIEYRELGRWEQNSVPLQVSQPYDERLETVEAYLRAEREALGAERMDRDIAILEQITSNGGTSEEAGATQNEAVAAD